MKVPEESIGFLEVLEAISRYMKVLEACTGCLEVEEASNAVSGGEFDASSGYLKCQEANCVSRGARDKQGISGGVGGKHCVSGDVGGKQCVFGGT